MFSNPKYKESKSTAIYTTSASGAAFYFRKLFMSRKYTPAEIIDVVANFQQKARERIQARLGWQWMGTKGRDDGISLGRKQRKWAMPAHTLFLALPTWH